MSDRTRNIAIVGAGSVGATVSAIGLAAARILHAILCNENRVLPVSSLVENLGGLSDVCLSMPSILSGSGVEPSMDVPMNDAERSGLTNSAAAARASLASLGF